MKTKQEQIEKMARTMCGYCSTDGKCAVSKNGREPDICANVDTEHCLYKEYAERLIENGCYGDVTEYKAEIEKLKAKIKQAQIDILNEVKKCSQCDNFFPDGNWHRYVLVSDIDKLIKGIEDESNKY